MRIPVSTARLATWSVTILMAMLIVMPFHAILTVWLSQVVGQYTALRLWKEVLLVLLGGVAAYILIRNSSVRQQVIRSKLIWVIMAFIVVQLVWGVVALLRGNVTAMALGYGWIIDIRFLLFFMESWVLVQASPRSGAWWPKLVFIPAAVVVVVGLLQYFVLPYDVLRHLGYSATTIFPYEDINHDTNYIRVMSTLRGANPLGAYLVLVITLFAAWASSWFRTAASSQQTKRLFLIALYAVASAIVLVLSFSRGAWLGLLVALAVLIWLRRKHLSMRLLAVGAALVATVGMLGVLALVVRNPVIQNVVLHTQDDSAISATSNEGHASALQMGLSDLFHEPLGRGPGSAGPASAYNTGHPVRIAENYFIQIGQETGWLGLLLFIDILVNVARLLFARPEQRLALGLLAALAGLTVVNFTSHAWADDTLAYLWWGLAGIAVAMPLMQRPNSETTN